MDHTTFDVLALAVTALPVVVGAAVLLRRAGAGVRTVGAVAVGVAGASAFGTTLLTILVLDRFGAVTSFGGARLVYMCGVIAIPIVAVALFAARARGYVLVRKGAIAVAGLSFLAAPLGVYFVLGDVDDPAGVRRMCEGTKVRFLKDEIVRLRIGDRQITLAGASTRFASLDFPSGATRVARALETEQRSDDIRILLTHAPDHVLLLPEPARTDLVIAGHTHGGQIQIPGWGAPVTLSRVPRAVGSGGLHTLGRRTVYVSRGVGMERKQAPRLRLFCVPEITLLTISAR